MTIIYIILIPMLVYNVSLIIQSITKPNETPSFFGIKMYVIISGSMQPELNIGDVVIVKNIDKDELKVEDVISFRKGQSVVTHRISEIVTVEGETQYRTKGDNNNVEDVDNISKKDIEGKVIHKISGVGKAVLLLKNQTAIISIVLFYYVFLVHDHSVQKRRAIRKMKREEYEAKINKESGNEEGKL